MSVIPVSVIIPTIMERRELLEECIKSIRSSTMRPQEILVSTDMVGAGPAVVRNHLAQAATNDWLAFVDDDDLVLSFHFEYLWNAITDDELKINYDVIYSKPEVQGRPSPKIGPFARTMIERGNYIPITSLVRKSVFHKAGGFDEDAKFEDWELWKNIARVRGKFRFVPEVTWVYRTIGNNRTREANLGLR